VIVEGGQKLSFSVEFCRDTQGELSGASVIVSYTETRVLRKAWLLWQRIRLRVAGALQTKLGSGPFTRKPVWVLGLLALIMAGFLYFQALKRNAPAPARQAHEAPQQIASAERPGRQTPGDLDTTRSAPGEVEGKLLPAVKSLLVAPLGVGPLSEQVQRLLTAALQSSNRFAVVENLSDADALFKGSVEAVAAAPGSSSATAGQVRLQLRLVNARGDVIWPASGRVREKRYVGLPEKVSANVVRDLLDEIRRLEPAGVSGSHKTR
jgi:hypothetical protein